MVLIRVSNISFDYRVIRTTSNSLKELLRDILRGSVKITNYAALQDVSFEVNEGEVLAILGGNGAGKSTLLKVLARDLPPQKGKVEINGDVAPMIELGAGFHPEVTGSENTVFYSALLGRDIKSVKQDLVKIAEWAGVEDHMDFPVRTFSSGMLARLAFSAATHERSRILLIDEVLSVGDEKFRAKTKQRIRDQLALGSAVVLVSHDLQTIREMATRAMWLEKGRVVLIGSTEDVIAAYQKSQE